MDRSRIIQVDEKVPIGQWIPLSIQHTFAMFSASVLVPWLFGINPAIVLLMNGIGTLIFLIINKGKAPAYLGSSFAFLAPTFLILANPNMGYQYALGGFVVTGLIFTAVAILIKFVGTDWIDILLPPAAMGPVVALIGLELAGTAASNGGLILSDTYTSINPKFVIVFLVTLGVAVFGQVMFRGFAAAIAILIAIIVGYVLALAMGIVDFSAVGETSLFAMPNFMFPKFNASAILIIIPASLVVISEHIGHQVVTSEIVGRDLLKDPGLHRSLISDGISTTLSGLCGSVPTTTYGENIGVMAITKVYSVWVIGGAASDPDHSGSGHGRRELPALRYDRGFRPETAGRQESGLLQTQKPGADCSGLRHRSVRRFHPDRTGAADRHVPGYHRGHGTGPGILLHRQGRPGER